MALYLAMWNNEPFRRIKLDEVDLECKVEDLKSLVSKTLGDKETQMLDLTFCGVVLEDGFPLSTYGITSGVTLHCIDKIDNSQTTTPQKITEAKVQDLLSSFRNFKTSPGFTATLHRLESPEEVDKVIAAVPGLENDPIAISFISKPDLILQMEDPKAVWQIGEKHPLLLEAAHYIATEFHKTTVTSSSVPSATTLSSSSSRYSYSLDALSDDDETMDEGASAVQGSITAAHLAAALAQAAGTAQGGSTGSALGGITAEMLQQAMPGSQYTEQLRQMRELGLADDGRSSRALALTQGDVQAAIDLVFSGALDD